MCLPMCLETNLRISSSMITGKEKYRTAIHSSQFKGVMRKIVCKENQQKQYYYLVQYHSMQAM